MQINNILEFDDEASAKAYNFTITAIKEFYDTIESDQFRDAEGDTIYEYLTKVMELVSFKEQLKRYIYETSGTKEAYSEVDYGALMLDAFEKNDCMAGKPKKELKRQINRWLNAETIKRENLFLIGFGLDMDDKMLTKFLTLVLKESDFDFNDPKEVIFWHCRHTGKTYQTAMSMLEDYEHLEQKEPVRADHRWQALQTMPKMYLGMEDQLWTYLHYLKFLQIADRKATKSREMFEKMYLRVQQAVADYMNYYPNEFAPVTRSEDINPAQIENILYTGVAVSDNGNLKAFAALKKQFKSKRLSRVRISGLLAGKTMERFDLITMIFLVYAVNEEKLSEPEGTRFTEFVEETNNLLAEAGMMALYPVNPYEAFILMCIVSSDPLDTFAVVWEKSYEESESSVQEHSR